MADSDPDGPALLEWLNSLPVVQASGARYERVAQLADGKALLKVMHDLSPDGFASPTSVRDGEFLLKLLEGLQEHLRDIGAEDELCQRLLEQAKAGLSVSPVRLAKLVLVATVQNDLPRRRQYVEAIMGLSVEAQQAAQAIIERFLSGQALESPSCTSPSEEDRRRFTSFGGGDPFNNFSSRHSAPSTSSRRHSISGPRATPGFMEAGLDTDTRFRRLKDEYILVMEEQERLQEQQAKLRQDLDAERERRRRAEEGEREARAELRLAEEAKERIREETRTLYEGRLEQDAGRAAERLKQKDLEIEALREELGLAKVQAATAERLENQLDLVKQKIEEHHTLRRENEELRVQVDDLMAKSGGGGAIAGGAHLQRTLARAREDAAAAGRERDEAQRQLHAVKDDLLHSKESERRLTEMIQALRRGGLGLGAAAGAEAVGAVAGSGRALALEAGAALLAAATAEGASAGEQLAGRQRQDDMLERLLAEKERATRAETTLQVKSAELVALQEQKIKDAVKVAMLEAQLEALKSQGSGAAGKPPSQEVVGKIQELENELTLRDSYFQEVLRMREAAEKESLHMQETFMASCFHELGLQLQKSRLQDQLSQLRGAGSGSPKR